VPPPVQLERDAAPGIHRVEDCYTNWYLVEGARGLTIVDAGIPSSWASLQAALAELGRGLDDIEALVLTHGHFDHMGFAERARSDLCVAVWVNELDEPLTRHPLQYGRERSPLRYLGRPAAARILGSLAVRRAFFPKPIAEVTRYIDGVLDVPGAPTIVATPGHTLGHCALHFSDRDAVIAGDAIVTLDPYTGRRGPRLVARAATADPIRALQSLDAIAATAAAILLPGHGAPWREGALKAAELARKAGSA
jgi:glyoxylase-like metal-dependent hydrolase (beta-lactamase superfamily II)